MATFMEEFEHLKIPIEEIKSATNNFDDKKVIGTGGFGKVYKGEISHSKEKSTVAFKRLDRKCGQGDAEFLKEIMMLSRYTHQNLISLLGFCNQGDEMILVYEHASRGSLDRHLNSPDLTWTQRLKICLGAAKGLNHLHDPRETHRRVIHCDIKSANILIDEKWSGKVSDFGLSKIGPANQQCSVLVTNALGTIGYCDPLYMNTYTLTKESDVYSFGVVLLEVLCGRLCFEYRNGQLNVLVPMWKQSYEENKLDEIIFHDLMQQMDPTSLETFTEIAFQCLQNSREQRPTMSLIVEKLEGLLEFQELYDLKVPQYYAEILKAAAPRLKYRSFEEFNVLLSNGVFLNAGKTWFYINDKGEHCVMISIAECLMPYEDVSSRYSSDYNSRFELGCYSTRGKNFNIRVKTQFLSPHITYAVNLVFKFSNRAIKPRYVPLKYELEGETKLSVVYLGDKREGEWLICKLYQFTSDDGTTFDHEFWFEDHAYCKSLEIKGIEFQPIENVEYDDQLVESKHGEILRAAVPPLIYGSIDELKLLLSKGILLNGGDTLIWLSINGNEEQYCVIIAIKELVIGDPLDYSIYKSEDYSRFGVTSYFPDDGEFRIRVRPQFLSPLITYAVNLLFKLCMTIMPPGPQVVEIRHKLHGETKTSISYLAEKRDDDWWMIELYQFISDGTTVDLEIIFTEMEWLIVDGIEFLPLKRVECQVLEDEKVDMQPPISHSDDTCWEQKLPNDYKDVIKLSKHHLRWTTKKELYYILRKGFLISYSSFSQRLFNNGQQWLSLDKDGKKCLMLSARAACILHMKGNWTSLPKSRYGDSLSFYRFREVVAIENDTERISLKEVKSHVLSPQTRYASYLVYKIRDNLSRFEAPVGVTQVLGSDFGKDYWYIYLVSPQTPVIRPKVGENTHNPLNRPKIEGIPQQRSDGWMEVQLYKFQTNTTRVAIQEHELRCRISLLGGLIIQGIELRPI